MPPTILREIGDGTLGDPRILWICSVTSDSRRTLGCENVCREGCSITYSTHVWIRHVDHDTTRTRSRRGVRMVRTDPHMTVYLSDDPRRYQYEGHLFIAYDRTRLPRKVPKRLAERRDLRLHRGPNPELWEYGTRRLVQFRYMAA